MLILSIVIRDESCRQFGRKQMLANQKNSFGVTIWEELRRCPVWAESSYRNQQFIFSGYRLNLRRKDSENWRGGARYGCRRQGSIVDTWRRASAIVTPEISNEDQNSTQDKGKSKKKILNSPIQLS